MKTSKLVSIRRFIGRNFKQWFDSLWTINYVAERASVAQRTIQKWVQRGKFPRPIALQKNVHRWEPSEVKAFEEKRKQKGQP